MLKWNLAKSQPFIGFHFFGQRKFKLVSKLVIKQHPRAPVVCPMIFYYGWLPHEYYFLLCGKVYDVLSISISIVLNLPMPNTHSMVDQSYVCQVI